MLTKSLFQLLTCGLIFALIGTNAAGATDPKAPVATPAVKPVVKTSAPAAARAPSLPALSAAQVVERNVAARGGLAAWKAVQTMTWMGKMGAGATTYETITAKGTLQQKQRQEPQLPFRLELKRPLKSRLELDFHDQTAVQVFDGVSGWKLRPFLGRTNWDAYTPEELQQASREPGIDGFLIDYAAKGARVDSAGTDIVDGHAAYKLKLTRKDGSVRNIWVDGGSFLDVKVDGEPRKLDGKPHAVSVYLRDYKRDKDLMIPHLLETAVQGVAKTEAIVIDSVVVNSSLDDARFSKPK